MKLPYFWDIDPSEEYFEAEFTDAKGHTLNLSLDTLAEELTEKHIAEVTHFLEHLGEYLPQIHETVIRDFATESTEYARHHMEELATELSHLTSVEAFLSEMKAVNVALYPTEEDFFAVVDLSIDEELTNYVLSASVDEKGKVLDVTIES